MENLLDTLYERGFVEQTTHAEELKEYFNSGSVTCYIGFDPTASSFHIGSLVPIMSLAHMQRHGHRPIALVGSGTGLVGDPSGRNEMRRLLSPQALAKNAEGIKKQLSRYLDFSDQKALMLNNADWLTALEYIPFLRDIGRYFSVNRMLRAESYKLRMESDEGLSFIEFNYMLLQAYDFLELFDSYGCKLQMGGSDQWGNIVAGIELIRRVKQETAFGITFPLIGTSSGEKMGKTAKGAVWLDPERTSPYEYYQYWINTDDRDVERFLALFTFLPMTEIRKIAALQGVDLNSAKTVLAFETTALAHGPEAAHGAYQKSISNFGERVVPPQVLPSSTIHPDAAGQEVSGQHPVNIQGQNISIIDAGKPDSYINEDEIKSGIPAFKLFHSVGLAASSSAARRLIEQGGAYLNAQRIQAFDQLITAKDLDAEKMLVLKSGKKRFHKIMVKYPDP
jgi:tyrosyl-tRNA synthetase